MYNESYIQVAMLRSLKKTFQENLRRLRREAGYTQDQLSELCEIDVTSVRRWETEDRWPRAEQIEKIANVFGIEPHEMLIPFEEGRLEEELSVQKGLEIVNRALGFSSPKRLPQGRNTYVSNNMKLIPEDIELALQNVPEEIIKKLSKLSKYEFIVLGKFVESIADGKLGEED